MRIWASIPMAVSALQTNKLRTGLTALGVIIGVARRASMGFRREAFRAG
jgi:hypothetical protein